jgi:hypothetical protein
VTAATWAALALLVGVVALLLIFSSNADGLSPFAAPCYRADLDDDGDVDLADLGSFHTPEPIFNTTPTDPNLLKWNLYDGGVTDTINLQDVAAPLPVGRICTAVQFMSKLIDADAQFNADPGAFAAMMNAEYEAVNTFDCGICRDFGDAFMGPSFVYRDPTKICGPSDAFCSPECEGEQPGTDCSDVLLTTTGARCWQRFFNGSRYLADITQADVQNEIVAHAQALIAEPSFDGYYFDVAEAWLPNAADCPGTPVVSNAGWLAAMATLVERLQNEVPGRLILNSQFFTWQSLVSTSATDADRVWAAPDTVEIEFGWAYGRHGEATVSGAQNKLAYLDRLHGLGTAIFDQDYDNGNADFPASRRDFGLAMYLITWEPGDLYGTFNQDGHGSAFWPTYNLDPGSPLGSRYSCGAGCYARDFTGGTVTANVVSKTGVLP